MVAMVVSSIMISLSLSLFLFSHKLFSIWRDSTELKASVNRTAQLMSLDIQRSSELVGLSDSAFVLQSASGKRVLYRFDGKNVYRDDMEVFVRHQGECRVRVTQEFGSTSRLYHIAVTGTSRAHRYEAQTIAAIPYSSRAEFRASL